MGRYIEQPPIEAPSLTAAVAVALRRHPSPLTHVLVDRTPDPSVFRVRTRQQRVDVDALYASERDPER